VPWSAGGAIKLGAPHIVDFGPENSRSPDGHLYAVGNGCLAAKPNSNCSWISGDAVFMARARGYSAAEPDSLNDPAKWKFFCGKQQQQQQHDSRAGGGAGGSLGGECWSPNVALAKPILTWEGRVGTVTSTWHPGLKRFLFAITTPTVLPSTVRNPRRWSSQCHCRADSSVHYALLAATVAAAAVATAAAAVLSLLLF
jgi:hypothetical protein